MDFITLSSGDLGVKRSAKKHLNSICFFVKFLKILSFLNSSILEMFCYLDGICVTLYLVNDF
ncbi:hypothetical protein BVAVS116_H0124 (plasmid) [Borreliella valaisiana VS116]|uniref:Uncharacterized protein n=1 Tax=Borreliella valaisiana VS116 TaxID=445987 RepID=C0R939_BORVA|nr:hypothetical protein BVAVS116_H0124 [Borreliella valaisiana VS116]